MELGRAEERERGEGARSWDEERSEREDSAFTQTLVP
jgi:hypothetical protein